MQQTEREKLVLDVKCLLLTTVSNFAHLGLVLTLFACYSKTQNSTHRLYKWPLCHFRSNLFCLKSDWKKEKRFEILDWYSKWQTCIKKKMSKDFFVKNFSSDFSLILPLFLLWISWFWVGESVFFSLIQVHHLIKWLLLYILFFLYVLMAQKKD